MNSAIEVQIGHMVKGVYIEFNVSADTVVNPKVVHWTVEVTSSGQTQGAPNTYYQDNRSQILKRGMEMLPKDMGTVYKRIVFVKIPRAYQRVKANYFLAFRYIASSAEAINICGFMIYKDIS